MQAHQLYAFLAPHSDATVAEKQAVLGPLKTEDSVLLVKSLFVHTTKTVSVCFRVGLHSNTYKAWNDEMYRCACCQRIEACYKMTHFFFLRGLFVFCSSPLALVSALRSLIFFIKSQNTYNIHGIRHTLSRQKRSCGVHILTSYNLT